MDYESDTVLSVQESLSLESGNGIPKTRPQRPCDACRKRKSRCEIAENDLKCVLCQFHKQSCTFVNDPPRKKRRTSDGLADPKRLGIEAISAEGQAGQTIQAPLPKGLSDDVRKGQTIKDYAEIRGPSLLKRTLGLQNHRHSSLLGSTSVYEARLLGRDPFRATPDIPVGSSSLRTVSASATFILTPDAGTRNHEHETDDLDAIEAVVAPHGQALVNLYFRIVHPTFPILHKRVFLEKYARTHREFSPPLLAAVYRLALNWWSYSSELSLLSKPDSSRLEEMAVKAMADIVHRPKLSTIQAGLLLLQTPGGDSWAMISQLVGLGQDLGLHLDCTDWRIPSWEKGLRKRLAWALYMQDKWGSLVHGRPSHITSSDWDVKPVDESDFPERAADEDDEEGSTEVEKGRVLFCEMIALARILADILHAFYTVRAETEIRANANSGAGWVLARAKPLQLRLRAWFTDLPECLCLQDVTMRKLSSTGYLHLAYYATEITLHRQIVRSLDSEPSADLVRVCRTAARERLVGALALVNMLRPEHLQSFWYWASAYNFALVGTFVSLLWVTSPVREDADMYRRKLDDYRWSLRLSSRNADIMERAIAMMATSTGVLVKALPDLTGTGGGGSGGGDGTASEASVAVGTEAPSEVGLMSERAASSSVGVVSPAAFSLFDGGRPDDVLSIDSHHLSWFADVVPLDPSAGEETVFSRLVRDDHQQFLGY